MYNMVMTGLLDTVVDNSKQIRDLYGRKSAVVREAGAEYSGKGDNGVANVHFPVDPLLGYISELKFKLIIGNGGVGGGIQPIPGSVIEGMNTWATLQDFLNQYPIGSAIDTDGSYGCTCWDYANVFWWGQVNRGLSTGGSGGAYGCWNIARAYNAGTEFSLITKWEDIKKGYWVVWGSPEKGANGHIAMAYQDATNSTDNLLFLGQNQPGGIATSGGGKALNIARFSPAGFLGAFAYIPWQNA